MGVQLHASSDRRWWQWDEDKIHIYIYIYIYLTTPLLGQDMTQGQFLSGVWTQSFPSRLVALTKAEEPSMPDYLPIAGWRIIGFIPFPRVLVLCEMQSVSSRIWTCVAVSISYDDNNYTTGTSMIYWYISITKKKIRAFRKKQLHIWNQYIKKDNNNCWYQCNKMFIDQCFYF